MSENPRLRLAVVGIVTISLVSAHFARLWYRQVLDSTTFVTAATTNQMTDAILAKLQDVRVPEMAGTGR